MLKKLWDAIIFFVPITELRTDSELDFFSVIVATESFGQIIALLDWLPQLNLLFL